MTGTRCATCRHSTAIHWKGQCPRWAGSLDAFAVRVVVRVGRKWPGCEGHTLAFMADAVEVQELGMRNGDARATPAIGMVLVWNLTADTQFDAPLLTAREPWSSAPTHDQVADAIDALKVQTGERIKVVKQLT